MKKQEIVRIILLWVFAYLVGCGLSIYSSKLPVYLQLLFCLAIFILAIVWVVIEIRILMKLRSRTETLKKQITHLNQQIEFQSRLLNEITQRKERP